MHSATRAIYLLALPALLTAGCSAGTSSGAARVAGQVEQERFTLTRAFHRSGPSLAAGHGPQDAASLTLTLANRGPACGAAATRRGPARPRHSLRIQRSLDSSRQPTLRQVRVSAGDRVFWGRGSLLLDPSRQSARELVGYLTLSVFADPQASGPRVGWIEGPFRSRLCGKHVAALRRWKALRE